MVLNLRRDIPKEENEMNKFRLSPFITKTLCFFKGKPITYERIISMSDWEFEELLNSISLCSMEVLYHNDN